MNSARTWNSLLKYSISGEISDGRLRTERSAKGAAYCSFRRAQFAQFSNDQ